MRMHTLQSLHADARQAARVAPFPPAPCRTPPRPLTSSFDASVSGALRDAGHGSAAIWNGAAPPGARTVRHVPTAGPLTAPRLA